MSKGRPDLDPNKGPSRGFSFEPSAATAALDSHQQLRLGPNAEHEPAIREAARRTGMPPSAIAAIIDAESAKAFHSNQWDVASKNPQSSARGLGQFLDQTWIEMANRNGTALHQACKDNHWLDKHGQLDPAHLQEALELRTKRPDLSIITTAEYDAKNLHDLQRKGLAPKQLDADQAARYAYLTHHEGLGGATEILTGHLHRDTAKLLYKANFPGSTARKDGFDQLAAVERDEKDGRGAISVAWEDLYPERLKRYAEDKIQPSKFLEPVLERTATLSEIAR